MATVREVRKILTPFSNAEATITSALNRRVHVSGFVTAADLKTLVERYNVFLHSNGALCVE